MFSFLLRKREASPGARWAPSPPVDSRRPSQRGGPSCRRFAPLFQSLISSCGGCEHMFVPTEGELLMRFRRAMEVEDSAQAIAIAGELSYVGLGDALELVRLLARKGDPRFERAANRWLTRLVAERKPSLGQVQVATAAMGALALDPDSEQALRALTGAIQTA